MYIIYDTIYMLYYLYHLLYLIYIYLSLYIWYIYDIYIWYIYLYMIYIYDIYIWYIYIYLIIRYGVYICIYPNTIFRPIFWVSNVQGQEPERFLRKAGGGSMAKVSRWRFPKSWGYPQIIQFFRGCSIKKTYPSIGVSHILRNSS